MEIHFLLLVPRIDRWDLLFARIMIRSPYQTTLQRCEDPFLPTEDREKFHLLLTLTPLAFPSAGSAERTDNFSFPRRNFQFTSPKGSEFFCS